MIKELSSQITTDCQKSARHQNVCIIGEKDSDENKCENEKYDETSVLKHRLPDVYDANKYVPLEQNFVDKRFLKEDCECIGNYIPVTWCVQFNTDVDEVFCAAAGFASSNHTNMLVGLHTCGDLTPMMMKIFSSSPRSQILCNVGCCYNLMEEKYCRNVYWKQDDSLPEDFGFPLSRPLLDRKFTLGQNARMLACESLDRITSSQATAQSSFFYRALLQVFLKDKGIQLLPDQHVGRISAKSRNFCDYVRKALQRLNIDKLQVDANELQEYMLKYHDYLQKLDAFFHIRAMLAPVVEGLILLDRLYFLIEKNPEAASYLVQLFDPVVSPRCYAFISVKK